MSIRRTLTAVLTATLLLGTAGCRNDNTPTSSPGGTGAGSKTGATTGSTAGKAATDLGQHPCRLIERTQATALLGSPEYREWPAQDVPAELSQDAADEGMAVGTCSAKGVNPGLVTGYVSSWAIEGPAREDFSGSRAKHTPGKDPMMGTVTEVTTPFGPDSFLSVEHGTSTQDWVCVGSVLRGSRTLMVTAQVGRNCGAEVTAMLKPYA